MRVVDLLLEHSLQLRLQTPSTEARLAWEVSGCSPTELMDPTPYLDPYTLLLTSGIAMNFSEKRTWDAFVERLATVPVAAIAFATGIAYKSLPPGLISACAAYDVPLLEVPSVIPTLQVDRYVESVMHAERLEVVDRGWTLADECARLANDGASIATLLAALFDRLQTPLAVYDAYGSVIAQYPGFVSWETGLSKKPKAGVLDIPLPMGLNNPCRLAVRQTNSDAPLAQLLGPAASIIALQLNRSVVDVTSHQKIKLLVTLCETWEEATHTDVMIAFQALELDWRSATTLLVADVSGEFASTSWQIRVALHDSFHTVRVTEFDDRLVAFAQDPRPDFDVAIERLLHIHERQPVVLKEPTTDLNELRLSVVHALDLVRHIYAPQRAPELGLSAVVAAAAGRGARKAAQRFLTPLVEHNAKRTGELVDTLRAYLRNDAQSLRTCNELLIHRNTLIYRLRKIESLLRVRLDTVEGQATCLLALSIGDIEA